MSSLPDLVNAFSAIANNITDVAGYDISMNTFTNYSNVSNTLSPDTVYMPNTTITKPGVGGHMVTVDIEPNITAKNTNELYMLTWPNIGNLSYNQNMTINYQLKVLNSGNITPITNASFVMFWQ